MFATSTSSDGLFYDSVQVVGQGHTAGRQVGDSTLDHSISVSAGRSAVSTCPIIVISVSLCRSLQLPCCLLRCVDAPLISLLHYTAAAVSGLAKTYISAVRNAVVVYPPSEFRIRYFSRNVTFLKIPLLNTLGSLIMFQDTGQL